MILFNKISSCLAILATLNAVSAAGVSMCYWGTWSYAEAYPTTYLVSDIDTSLCTHVVYSFIGLNFEGNLLLLDEEFDIGQNGIADLVALKTTTPDLKVLVALGGWTQGSANYSEVAGNAEKRASIIQQTVDFLNEHGFDGLDMDWEYPNKDGADAGGREVDYVNFVTWLEEYRVAFDAVGKGWLLTAAVSPTQSSIDTSYNVTALNANLDYINLMTYDLHGVWDGVTGANAPLYAQPSDVDATLTVSGGVEAWINAGATPAKLTLGIGSYGKAYTLADVRSNETGANITGAGTAGPWEGATTTWSYMEICSDQKNNTDAWTIVNYEDSYVYAIKGDLWIGYDNYETALAKGQYAKEKALGGVMLWSTDNDDFRGLCGTKNPILTAAVTGYGL